MKEDAFLSALHESPADEVTWLALADWLEEDGQNDRAELLRIVRLLRTLPVMKRTKQRIALEERLAALLLAGVRPVVPEVVNSIGMRFALIPPGRFRMGSPRGEPGGCEDEPAHEVEITKPFYLGVFPVTQAQYERVLGYNPSFFQVDDEGEDLVVGLDTSQFPVECVSFNDLSEFCERLGEILGEIRRGRTYRPPTEAEWEYACRASTTAATSLGPTLSSRQANFNGSVPYRDSVGPFLGRPSAVGSYVPNAFGLYDMLGNVSEWCSDWYDSTYSTTRQRDPQGPPTGEEHPLRGGSWDSDGKCCRCAWRDYNDPGARIYNSGLRVVLIQ
jgi:uncharacterized protein (TIGR02996 family)